MRDILSALDERISASTAYFREFFLTKERLLDAFDHEGRSGDYEATLYLQGLILEKYVIYFILLSRNIGIIGSKMAIVKKSISVTDQQNEWIKAQIEKGQYGNESEVVRDLIRERQLREMDTPEEIKIIRSKLLEAEKSGFTDQSAEEILAEIKDELRRDGEL
ncbi:MAG: type II toxin-antitoxin system ParD family antitoxin [Sneathiellales bacterium]|nr:type II toxin-antitoxin system ParD family antitoxin [Sneathiellales bacterium]